MVELNGMQRREDDNVVEKALIQAGAFKSNLAGLFGLPLFDKQFLERLYAVPSLRRVTRFLATSSILKGWEISFYRSVNRKSSKIDDGEIIAKYKEYEDKLFLRSKFAKAQIQANIYRGAVLIFYIDDGRSHDQPVDFKNIKTIEKIEIVDSNRISPYFVGTDVFDPENVEHYQLNTPSISDKNLGIEGKIHSSRVIRFDGIEMPADVMSQNNGWGLSLLEVLFWDFDNWRSSLSDLRDILDNFNLFIYKVSDYRKMVANNDEKSLAARFRAFRKTIEEFGGGAIDADKESVEFIAKQLSGIESLYREIRDAYIGATGSSHDVMFGESPSGLGASGENEQKNAAKEVAMFQVLEWEPKLLQASKLIIAAQDGPSKGEPIPPFSFSFFSILQETLREKLQARSEQAQIDSGYLNMGVLTAGEIRRSRFGKGGEFSFETELNDEEWEQEQQSGQQQQGFGFDSLESDSSIQRLEKKLDNLIALVAQLFQRQDAQDDLQLLVEQTAGKVNMEEWIKTANSWLSSHETIQEAIDSIGDLYEQVNDEKLREVIEEYSLLADLYGRTEASSPSG